jgi:hypothetical protein
MLGTTMRPSRRGEEMAVTLPVLAEGDVLLLD